MKVVQPIRDLDVLDKCYDIAREHDRQKKTGEVSWELILLVGFNTSLRVSDFRRFKVQDIRGKDYAQIQAKKTGKEYILQSKQKDYATHKPRPISRQRVYQIMNTIAKRAGIEERIGCHTLRKTFGYHYYKMTGDVVSLQRILCHSYQRETLIYIGVIQENIDESLMKFNVLSGRKRGKQYDSRGQDSSV